MTFKPQYNKDHVGFIDIPIWSNRAVSLKGEVINTRTGKLHPQTLHCKRRTTDAHTVDKPPKGIGHFYTCSYEAYSDEAARVNFNVPLLIHHCETGQHICRTVKALLFNALVGETKNVITRPIACYDGEKITLLESVQRAITWHNENIKPDRPATRWKIGKALQLNSGLFDAVAYYDLTEIPLWLREYLVQKWMTQQGV